MASWFETHGLPRSSPRGFNGPHPESLTQKAANEMALLRELVMAGTKPGHDEKANRFQAVR
jgi:hypothetical protein